MTPAELTWAGLEKYQDTPITQDSFRKMLLSEVPPGFIFHAAGGASVGQSWKNPELDRQNTLETTEHLLEAISQIAPQTHLIFASSAAVYGNAGMDILSEDSPCNPVSPYGEHKLLAEQACLRVANETGMKLSIIRFFSLYGPYLRKQILWDIIHRLRENSAELQLGGMGSEKRDYLHAGDAAQLIVDVTRRETASPLVLNGGTGVGTTVQDLAQSLLNALNLNTRLSFSGIRPAGDPINLVADISRARGIGFSPRLTLQEGLKDYVAWIGSQKLTHADKEI